VPDGGEGGEGGGGIHLKRLLDGLARVAGVEGWWRGRGGHEDEDGAIDTALRELQRVQGPTCAAAVRGLSGTEEKKHLRSRGPNPLSACLS
jgi:hypothetical protein